MTDWEQKWPYHQLVWVEGGSFMMGRADEEAFDREKPVRKVALQGFYLGKYPVTQDLWKGVMGENPASFKGLHRPVEQVSWHETQTFLKKLNKITNRAYRLPTEAEWEYAARGGKRSEGYFYAGSDRLEQVGWYITNSGQGTQPVGQKLPNELGLYDMSGNVREWVEDQWHKTYSGAPTDGSAWVDQEEGAPRVRRGGSWLSHARSCRVSYRYHFTPENRNSNLGFRLALALPSGG